MSDSGSQPDRGQWPWLTEGLIALGFVLIVAAAVVTVVIPELSDESERPDPPATAATPDAGV